MTIEEFGKTIKKKYPQYNDMDDMDLGQKVLTKYPQYQDMISVEGEQPKKSFIEKAGDFLGLSSLSKGLGLSIGRFTDPELKRIEEKQNKGEQLTQGEAAYYSEFFKEAPTSKQIIGSALQTGASVLTAGIAGGKILPTALKFGGAGAVSGFGKGMEENKNFRQAATQAFMTGALSLGVSGTIGLAGKGIQKILTKAPEKLYNSALKVNEKILRQGKSPSKVLIEDGTFGGLGKIMKQSQEGIDEMNTKIAEKVSQTNIKLKSRDILGEVLNKLKSKYGAAYSESELEAVIETLPVNQLKMAQSITLGQANILRQQLDNLVSGKFGQEVLRGSLKEKAVYHTTNILRNEIQKITGTTDEFYRLSRYIQAQKLTEKAIAHADKYWMPGLKDIIFGGGIAGAIGGIPGAIGGTIASKLLKSPALETTAAILLDRIQKIPTDTAGKISKIMLLNIIKNVTVGEETQMQTEK